jgi:hypothetical protein
MTKKTIRQPRLKSVPENPIKPPPAEGCIAPVSHIAMPAIKNNVSMNCVRCRLTMSLNLALLADI